MIETKRLIVRQWRDADRDEYVGSCNSEAVTEHLGGPQNIEDIDAALSRVRKSQEEHGFCFWAVERKTDGKFLGCCWLKITAGPAYPFDGDIEIGWRFREDVWGQGYAFEAARACLEWAWANLDVPRIVSMTVPGNRPSWRLMERLGMERRPDLDFAHPAFAPDHPLSAHITYVANRP